MSCMRGRSDDIHTNNQESENNTNIYTATLLFYFVSSSIYTRSTFSFHLHTTMYESMHTKTITIHVG